MPRRIRLFWLAVNWTYNNKEVLTLSDIPEGVEHFVYIITDENGRKYIGKKQILEKRNPEVSKAVYDRLKKEGHPVRRTKNKTKSTKKKIVWRYKKYIIKESNWSNYTGSCIPLNREIRANLKYTKEILHFCKTKKQATYYELKHQFCQGVIENDLYWNENVLSKFFRKDLT